MPPQADNPDGFWEHLGFVALNDELLNALGGAWDLPPKTDEDFKHPQLDPLRLKARILIEGFASANVWGWKDPRNSLTLPFWEDLLPGLRTLIVVRNPLEVAYSMRERNGTSYSFGLRLWEIYNRCVIETATKEARLVTHYDLFFENAETELRRIVHFTGLPDTKVKEVAALITAQKRHTHFTIDQLIDARVSEKVIELYRDLVAEATQGTGAAATERNKTKIAKPWETTKEREAALLPGAVTRLNAFVPERETVRRELALRRGSEVEHLARIENLERENRQLLLHLARQDGRIAEMEVGVLRQEKERAHLERELQQFSVAHERDRGALLREIEKLRDHLAQTEAHYKAQVKELTDRFVQINELLRSRSISLAESESRSQELQNRSAKTAASYKTA